MTKVALLHYSAPPVVGGVESVLGHHAHLMAEAGHQVQIIAGRGQQVDPRISFVPLPMADSRHPNVLALKSDLDEGRVPTGFAEAVGPHPSQMRRVIAADARDPALGPRRMNLDASGFVE